HMTGNRSHLTDYKEINGGFVAFGGNSKGGKIIRKGKIRTGSGPNWIFDIDALTKSMNYKPVFARNQSNGSADPLFSSSSKDSPGDGFKPSREEEKYNTKDPGNENSKISSTEEPRDNAIDDNIVYGCVDDQNIHDLEEIGRFSDAEDDDSGADINNLDTNLQ
nr:hypothetical protein [Tanacetum cinerariifolium]